MDVEKSARAATDFTPCLQPLGPCSISNPFKYQERCDCNLTSVNMADPPSLASLVVVLVTRSSGNAGHKGLVTSILDLP